MHTQKDNNNPPPLRLKINISEGRVITCDLLSLVKLMQDHRKIAKRKASAKVALGLALALFCIPALAAWIATK